MKKHLREYQGKKLVSFLRKGDYAHAGGIEAIELVMAKFKKIPQQLILDVGCGLGGTTNYIQAHNWGNTTGIDIEKKSIEYARECYNKIKFQECNAECLSSNFSKQFDIVCLFNSFYAFNNQKNVLSSIQKVTKTGGSLAIFDYADLTNNRNNPLYREGRGDITPFKPVNIHTIEKELCSTKWHSTKIIDMSEAFLHWYNMLIGRISSNQKYIKTNYGENIYKKSIETYGKIINCIQEKKLGGIIIYAVAK